MTPHKGRSVSGACSPLGSRSRKIDCTGYGGFCRWSDAAPFLELAKGIFQAGLCEINQLILAYETTDVILLRVWLYMVERIARRQ